MANVSTNEINKGAVIYLVRSFAAPVVMGLLFFISAGSIAHSRAWYFYSLFAALSIGLNSYLFVKDRELLFHRNRFKSDAKSWDKIIMPIAVLTGFHFQSVAMGLDLRFSNEVMNAPAFIVTGTILFILSTSISTWAMKANRHFEANVRIQQDRNHSVTTTGPYTFVRHPGYLAFIFGTFGVPMIIGSTWGFVNALLGSLFIVLRTYKEDQTLKEELSGYLEYTSRVKFRLFPGLW